MAYALRKSVGVISNDEDRPAAEFLVSALTMKGYLATYIPARDVKKTITGDPDLRDGKQSYVIIGGHMAPDSGWISSWFLKDYEERALEQTGAAMTFGPYYGGLFWDQFMVYVVAGYNYLDTRRAVEAFEFGVPSLVAPPGIPGVPPEIMGIRTEHLILGGAALLALFIVTRR